MAEEKHGVGLVLDGGGGKGAYHVGILKSLKEQGLLDDVTAISGASIGLVNAMLFAMDDIDLMYKAWNDIDMQTVFDFDLNMIMDNKPYFSRSEMLTLVEKYIDFDKLKNGKYKIYGSICRLDEYKQPQSAEYKCLNTYDIDTIKKILLASTALPVIYEAVEIEGNFYRDGGIMDNEPIQPLYDAGIRDFIVISLNYAKQFTSEKWPDANFVFLKPSRDLGNLMDGTLNFDERAVEFREMLGEKDGIRALKTKFAPEDMYINLEPVLAQNDYNEIMMKLRASNTARIIETRVSSNISKFEEIAKKYENF